MKKWLFLVTSLLVLNPDSASACSCLRSTPEEHFARANAVFSGKVIEVDGKQNTQIPLPDSFLNRQIKFEVSRVWKGNVEKQEVVLTSDSSASCGYSFEKGKEYLVYASEQDGKLQTGLCSGTNLLSQAQENLETLGQGKTPNNQNNQNSNLNPQRSNKAQLRRSQRLWKKQKISNYRYTLSRSCFCLREATQPVVIEVRNGKVRSIVAANTGKSVNREYFTQYDSMAKIFDTVKDAIAKNAHQVSATYHPTLGYPTQISIDYDQLMADEELYLTIENLEVIK